MQPGAQIPGSP
jgi:hypothetical protein